MTRPAPTLGRTVVLTLLTLLAFAGNSILGRLALADGAIDPLTFSAVRLLSGALILLPFLRAGGAARPPWRPIAALALLAYALPFSLAYVSLDAGVGALLLFGAVQVTMLGVGHLRGERLRPAQWLGGSLAVLGFLVLVRPGLTAPAPMGAALMTLAGVAWGTYSLLGRGLAQPTLATARNFLMAAPLALLVRLLVSAPRPEPRGLALAVASGALTSGLGYALWYAALRGHSRISAALVQLAVPVIAALGGAWLLAEALTPRLVASAGLTVGGIALAILGGARALAATQPATAEAEHLPGADEAL